MSSQEDTSTRTSHDFARSQATGRSPPVQITPEPEAHSRLKAEWKQYSCLPTADHASRKEVLVADIHDFEVYHSPSDKRRALELIGLHFLGLSPGKKLCFDGFVRMGNVKCYIQGIPIKDISIEGYGEEETPNVTLYIQSELAANDATYDIWYRLNTPTARYQRFHSPCLWVSQLGKHVIDYMTKASRSLISFRSDFHSFLTERFAGNSDFETWHAAFEKKTDFRVAVVAYIDYLFTQAYHLPNFEHLVNQPLWTECMARAVTSIPPSTTDHAPTVATPAVYACSKDMYFGKTMREMRPKRIVQAEQQLRKRKLGFADTPVSHTCALSYAELSKHCQPYGASPVMVGDVVALVPDETDSRVWKHTKHDWLAYVQRTETLHDGTQRLFVLWLYWPHDTNIGNAHYPFNNELFLSDNCNCTERTLLSTDIKGKFNVDWCPSVIRSASFFIRQHYTTQTSSFVTLKDEQKTCQCRNKNSRDNESSIYRSGDTVYLEPGRGRSLLEPVIIQQINRDKGTVLVRRLLRLERDCSELAKKAKRSHIAPNELILTDRCHVVDVSQVQRHCFIRFVSKSEVEKDQVPFPYNCGGAGDFWFISMGLVLKEDVKQIVFLRRLPKCVRQRLKFDFCQKLRGLSIFSGGGSLDRGLEEGGAVEFRTVVDSSIHAIRTQQANTKNPERIYLYCGSVNDFLSSVLKHDADVGVRVGEVDFIAAGSPCVAFSMLQKKIYSVQSLHNASLISSFCSFVDLYRPLYGVLENVLQISSQRSNYVLCQVIASLVSMGYQVDQYIMDAWSYGSSQQRSRLILTIAAPGLQPIMQPLHTHSRSDEDAPARSLGKLPNGLLYGGRECYPTPFHHVPASTVSSGLPIIGNGITQTCIPYPDHRVVTLPTRKERSLLQHIPREPPGCGYKEAEQLGLIPHHLRVHRKDVGKAYSRIKKDGLVPTIVTDAQPRNARIGAVVHWDEPRSISLQEARRAQGYRDEEPIIGTLREQYRIVGNGVDRKVGFSMGLQLLYALEKSKLEFPLPGAAGPYSTSDEKAIEDEGDSVQNDESDSAAPILATSQVLIKRLQSLVPDRPRHSTQSEQPKAENSEESRHRVKRPRTQTRSSSTSDTVGDSTSLPSDSDSTQRSTRLKKTRYTRHSGLAVEFVPRNWDKRVEREYSDSTT